MPRCCGGASCSCVLEEAAHINIVGTGSPGDPFVIAADVAVQVADNPTFDLTLTGLGTAASPWVIGVTFAATAKLNDLPDVTAPTPTNGQVLGWDTATSQWTPRAPTTAAAGAVLHDTSLAGDGSAGTPLQVLRDPSAYLGTTAQGLGMNANGINQLARKFPDAAARTAAVVPPTLNTLSLLDTAPGQIDYWDGAAWTQAGGSFLLAAVTGQEMYQMSGAYAGGRLKVVVRNVTTTTDGNGEFDAITPADLTGQAGIMSAHAQPIAPPGGLSSIPTPFVVALAGASGGLRGKAFRVDTGAPLTLSPVNLTVTAFIY
jgi:hypothetical protein